MLMQAGPALGGKCTLPRVIYPSLALLLCQAGSGSSFLSFQQMVKKPTNKMFILDVVGSKVKDGDHKETYVCALGRKGTTEETTNAV